MLHVEQHEFEARQPGKFAGFLIVAFEPEADRGLAQVHLHRHGGVQSFSWMGFEGQAMLLRTWAARALATALKSLVAEIDHDLRVGEPGQAEIGAQNAQAFGHLGLAHRGDADAGDDRCADAGHRAADADLRPWLSGARQRPYGRFAVETRIGKGDKRKRLLHRTGYRA